MDTNSLLAAILDSVDSQIAVIDRNGVIIYFNQAWRDFASANGIPADFPWVGTSYLEVCKTSAACGDLDSAEVHEGICTVLDGISTAFTHEYPCHSPDEKRWFMMRISSLHEFPDYFVVSHHNITERKLSEDRIEQYNHELIRLSVIDKLTQIANRTRLDQALDHELYRAWRYGSTFAVILLDIDHFKSVNDNYGHLVGDRVLVAVAEVLQSCVRDSDIVGRWGGEEFLILQPECDISAALLMAEKLRAAIAACDFPDLGHLTCSFGVSAYKPGATATSLIACVDAALYKAKHNGRNRVEVAAKN